MKKMKMINMNIMMINLKEDVPEDQKEKKLMFHVMKQDNAYAQHVIRYLLMKTHYINIKYYI